MDTLLNKIYTEFRGLHLAARKFSLLILLMLLIGFFFFGHNTGAQSQILRHGFTMVATTLLDLLTVGAVIFVSGGIGRWFGRSTIETKQLKRAETVALESGFGLGLISIVTLLLGLAGFFNYVMWILLALVALLTIRSGLSWLADFISVLRRALQPQTPFTRFITIFCGILLLAALLLALAPPFAWDAMTYHLEGPQRYIQAGHIAPQADNHFLGFPQAVEVLYGLTMRLAGRDTAAAPLHFYFGLLALMSTAGLLRRVANRDAAYLSVLLYLSSFSIWLLFGWPYVDLVVMAYGAFSLITMTQWRATNMRGWLILAGLFAGMALGAKYTAGMLIITLGIFILVRQPKQTIRNGLLFGGAVFIIFLPWLIKGLVLYQNPLYPYIFGGVNWDALRAANFGASGSGLLNSNLTGLLPLLPLAATVFGIEGVSPFSFSLGPWLMTAPFILIFSWKYLNKRQRGFVRDMLLFAIPLLICWYLLAAISGIGAQPRLMLVGMPVVVILGTLGLESLAQWPRGSLKIQFVLRAILIFTILVGLFDVMHEWGKTQVTDYYAGTINRDTYLHLNLGIYYPALQQLDSLPHNSTVQFMWEPKSFYCPEHIRCIPDVLFDHWTRPILLGADPDALMQQWHNRGVDYLLLHDSLRPGESFGYDFWSQMHRDARSAYVIFPEKLEQYWQAIWMDEIGYTLYEWRN